MKGGGNMTEAELKKELKSGDFRRFYFIYGEDNYLKNHYAAQIAKKSAAVLPDMNYKKLDGEKTDFQTIYAQTEQLPCMADYRCVLVTDYNFASASDDEQTSVVDMISDLPESTVLVMLADTLEISPKKPGKWQKLIKAAEKHGGVLYFEHMSVSGLQNMLIKGAQKRKVMLDLSTAAYMVECCGREISKLQNELDKLGRALALPYAWPHAYGGSFVYVFLKQFFIALRPFIIAKRYAHAFGQRIKRRPRLIRHYSLYRAYAASKRRRRAH